MTVIYLDHNATTELDPLVLEEMLPWMKNFCGNPSSIHAPGQQARRAMDTARAQVARLIGALPEEIVFTSGGTETNNLAILGAVAAFAGGNPSVVTTTIEHQSVINPCRQIERGQSSVFSIPVDSQGMVLVDEAARMFNRNPLLASVMLANNEVGTIQPVKELTALAHQHGGLMHTDAVQAVGKIPVDVKALGVDLLSFSAHKLHGPQGVGALYIRTGTKMAPVFFGGHQERGIRPGTEHLAAIVGFGKACELALMRLHEDAAYLEALRSSFEAALLGGISGCSVNGQGAIRLPNTSNVSFQNIDGEMLAINLDLRGLAVSTGAACSTVDREPSPVLMAMGQTAAQARSSLRFSFGRNNSQQEVNKAVDLVRQAVEIIKS